MSQRCVVQLLSSARSFFLSFSFCRYLFVWFFFWFLIFLFSFESGKEEEEEEPLLIYTAQGSPFRRKKLSVINGSPEQQRTKTTLNI